MGSRLFIIYCYHCKKTGSVLANSVPSALLTASCFPVATTLHRFALCSGAGQIPSLRHVRQCLCRLLPGTGPLLCLGWHFLLQVLPNRCTCKEVSYRLRGKFPLFRKTIILRVFFFPFLCTFNENKLFFNLNKLPQLYSVHKHKHSQVAIFVPIPFDVLSCTLSRTEHPLSDFFVLAHFALKLPLL